MTTTLTAHLARTYTRPGRCRTYGTPRQPHDHMLKDIGISADDIGLLRKR